MLETGPSRERRRVTTAVGSVTRTKQSMAKACDVNAIMRKYLSTGTLEHLSGGTPVYGDFTNVTDYQDALERVRAAQAHFDALPAAVRDHCDNDPGELLRMSEDPEREDEMRELGLLPPEDTSPQKPDESGQNAPDAEPGEGEPGAE